MTVEQKSGQQQDADSAAACPEGAEGLSALEADLQAAEARVEAAEARYLRSRRQLARAEEPAPTESEDRAATTAGHTPSASQAARSAAERSEKCLEDRRPPARETLGQLQVQAHGQTSDEVHVAGQAHGEPAAVREGAQSIADRLKRLQRRASAAEMRASAVEVLKGGGYTFEPLDVVLDLQRRGLLEQGFVAELIQWLPPESQVLGPDLLNDGCASSSNDRPFQDVGSDGGLLHQSLHRNQSEVSPCARWARPCIARRPESARGRRTGTAPLVAAWPWLASACTGVPDLP